MTDELPTLHITAADLDADGFYVGSADVTAWKGHIEIDGRKYWVSGWERQTKRGDAISLKLEEAKPASMAYAENTDTRKPQKRAESDFDSDSIPF